MPIKKVEFLVINDDLSKSTDVDDSAGRSVPQNMNFIQEGYLTKDTGSSLFGAIETKLAHSPIYYKKKDGTKFLLRVLDTHVQSYNFTTKLWADTTKTVTADAKMGWLVYNDILYGGNAVDTTFSFNGTTYSDITAAPKGNILEVFEDRLFIAGVIAEPLTAYYSNIAAPTTWTGTDILKPLGTDSITGLKNFYGTLLIFKTGSIWKLTFVYDPVTSLYIPKLEIQSQNYGACSRTAISWVESDVWFFTGREVRSIGFKDQQIGILGVNPAVISEPIKETLYKIDKANYGNISVFYFQRKFYLSIPLSLASTVNNTVFVCHLLYKNQWTKYVNRIKATTSEFFEMEKTLYSLSSVTPFGSILWDETLLDDNGVAIPSSVAFKVIDDKDFNHFMMYRYLDLMFKNIIGRVTVNLKSDANDYRSVVTKTFAVGNLAEGMENALGEVTTGQYLVGDSFGEDVSTSPFSKKRISFLLKSQGITIELVNANMGETFTIAQFILQGYKEERNLFKPANIISV